MSVGPVKQGFLFSWPYYPFCKVLVFSCSTTCVPLRHHKDLCHQIFQFGLNCILQVMALGVVDTNIHMADWGLNHTIVRDTPLNVQGVGCLQKRKSIP